jgi:hypothetical protein
MCLAETNNRVRVGRNLSDSFSIRNGLKQGDALSPLLFNFALEYAIRRVRVNQDGLGLNSTHQPLAYADDVNILGGSVHNVKENAKALVVAAKEIGLEVNADKTKYMVMSRDQNAGRTHCMKSDNGSFERVEEFKYLGTNLTSDNTWSLTLREELRMRVFENRVLRRIFGSRSNEVTGEWRRLHNEELIDPYSSPNIVRVIKLRRMRWAKHVARMGRGEVRIGFWSGNLRGGDHWGDPGVDGRIILRRIFGKWDVGVWTSLGWLRIGKAGGRL